VKYAFIKQSLGSYPVNACCKALGVSRSGYYDAQGRPQSARSKRRATLAAEVRAVHEQSRRRYGSPRVCRVLKGRKVGVSENTVAKIMHEEGLFARSKMKFVPRTTDSTHDKPTAENRLGRDFSAAAPNRKWVADITYIPTAAGWLYLAVVLDLFSRRVVGWATSDRLGEGVALEALGMGLARRRPRPGLLHHSDRGSQYASVEYRAVLAGHGMERSMSGVGRCWDNAVAESFFATLKVELDHDGAWRTRADAHRAVFDYIELFYNADRRHSTLGYLSPLAFERQWQSAS